MLRSELIAKIHAENPQLDQKDAEQIVSIIFDRIVEQMASGGRVELRGFGVFTTKQRGARMGRNPRNGESVTVEEKAVPFFKAGKTLRQRLNSQ